MLESIRDNDKLNFSLEGILAARSNSILMTRPRNEFAMWPSDFIGLKA